MLFTTRRYQLWHLIPDLAERKLAVIRLHSEGWHVSSIAEYLQTTRHTIYDTLKRVDRRITLHFFDTISFR